MGMLFGGWIREEEEEWRESGLSWEEFKSKKDYDRDNCNLTYTKKFGRFRGVELNEGDLICEKLNSDFYYINDFQSDGRPICTLVKNEKHDFWNKPYPFDTVLVIKPII